jgi:hypothetical protein
MSLTAQKTDNYDGHVKVPDTIIKMYFTRNAATTIAVGDVVALDFDATDCAAYGYMKCVDIGDATVNDLACGIVRDLLDTDGTSAGYILVQVKGEYGPVDCDTGLALYDPVIVSATAGDCKIYVETGLYPPFGRCTFADPGGGGGTHTTFGAIADNECVIYMTDIFGLASL